MTVSEFKQEIKSRTNRRTSLTAHDNSLPLEAVIHITEAIVEDNHPAVILFRDGINMNEPRKSKLTDHLPFAHLCVKIIKKTGVVNNEQQAQCKQ